MGACTSSGTGIVHLSDTLLGQSTSLVRTVTGVYLFDKYELFKPYVRSDDFKT